MVEIKAAKRLIEENEAQLLNYLKARPPRLSPPARSCLAVAGGLRRGGRACGYLRRSAS
ncbi:MAG: hypothetical protein JRJ77_08075 [Deltaproteobacteria bacterium]|nr:hypothetical protein [Deltaproteobacteria bacterium]MBW2340292.1 hypothetical protein [Deltaproteobacteria bacterium]